MICSSEVIVVDVLVDLVELGGERIVGRGSIGGGWECGSKWEECALLRYSRDNGYFVFERGH